MAVGSNQDSTTGLDAVQVADGFVVLVDLWNADDDAELGRSDSTETGTPS